MRMRKTGVIGVGETGAALLEHLASDLAERFREFPAGIELIGLVNQPRDSAVPIHWLDISVANEELRALLQHSDVRKTLPGGLDDEVFAEGEPRRFNVMGRLMLLHHNRAIRGVLAEARDTLTTVNLPGFEDRPRYVIVGSLSDALCTGMLIDLAYLLRYTADDRVMPEISAVLLLPERRDGTEDDQGDWNDQLVRAYVTLRELHYFAHDGLYSLRFGDFVLPPPGAEERAYTQRSPFERGQIAFVDNRNQAGRIVGSETAAVEWLYHSIVTPHSFSNLVPTNNFGHASEYLGVGTGSLVLPITALRDYFQHRLASDIVKEFFAVEKQENARNDADKEANELRARTQLDDQGSAIDSIRSAILSQFSHYRFNAAGIVRALSLRSPERGFSSATETIHYKLLKRFSDLRRPGASLAVSFEDLEKGWLVEQRKFETAALQAIEDDVTRRLSYVTGDMDQPDGVMFTYQMLSRLARLLARSVEKADRQYIELFGKRKNYDQNIADAVQRLGQAERRFVGATSSALLLPLVFFVALLLYVALFALVELGDWKGLPLIFGFIGLTATLAYSTYHAATGRRDMLAQRWTEYHAYQNDLFFGRRKRELVHTINRDIELMLERIERLRTKINKVNQTLENDVRERKAWLDERMARRGVTPLETWLISPTDVEDYYREITHDQMQRIVGEMETSPLIRWISPLYTDARIRDELLQHVLEYIDTVLSQKNVTAHLSNFTSTERESLLRELRALSEPASIDPKQDQHITRAPDFQPVHEAIIMYDPEGAHDIVDQLRALEMQHIIPSSERDRLTRLTVQPGVPLYILPYVETGRAWYDKSMYTVGRAPYHSERGRMTVPDIWPAGRAIGLKRCPVTGDELLSVRLSVALARMFGLFLQQDGNANGRYFFLYSTENKRFAGLPPERVEAGSTPEDCCILLYAHSEYFDMLATDIDTGLRVLTTVEEANRIYHYATARGSDGDPSGQWFRPRDFAEWERDELLRYHDLLIAFFRRTSGTVSVESASRSQESVLTPPRKSGPKDDAIPY